MNCYDLTLEFIRVLEELQLLIDKKSSSNKSEHYRLDKEIDKLEAKMMEIKRTLKSKELY